MQELEGIKGIVMGELASKKQIKIEYISKILFLDENIIWKAIESLMEQGLVFQKDEQTISLV